MIHYPSFAETLAVSRAHGASSKAPGLWKGLALGMPMTEGGGSTTHDLSGYGNHGTLTNMDPATDWVVGENGWAIDYGAYTNSHYVNITRKVVPDGGYRVSVFCTFRVTGGSGQRRMLFETEPDYSISLGLQTDNKLQAYAHGNVGSVNVFSTNTPELNEWHAAAWVCDGSNLLLYLDADAPTSVAFSQTLAPSAGFHIGTYRSANGRWWHGQIGPLYVWDRAITTGEYERLRYDPLLPLRLRQRVFPAVVAAAATIVTPSPASATWSVPAPSLKKAIGLSPASATWSVPVPLISVTISPTPVTATWSVTTPTLRKSIAPTPLSATWSVTAITAVKTISPSPVSVAWSITTPTLRKRITTAAVSATWLILSPGLRKSLTPNPLSATWTAVAPATECGGVILPAGLLQSGHYHLGA